MSFLGKVGRVLGKGLNAAAPVAQQYAIQRYEEDAQAKRDETLQKYREKEISAGEKFQATENTKTRTQAMTIENDRMLQESIENEQRQKNTDRTYNLDKDALDIRRTEATNNAALFDIQKQVAQLSLDQNKRLEEFQKKIADPSTSNDDLITALKAYRNLTGQKDTDIVKVDGGSHIDEATGLAVQDRDILFDLLSGKVVSTSGGQAPIEPTADNPMALIRDDVSVPTDEVSAGPAKETATKSKSTTGILDQPAAEEKPGKGKNGVNLLNYIDASKPQQTISDMFADDDTLIGKGINAVKAGTKAVSDVISEDMTRTDEHIVVKNVEYVRKLLNTKKLPAFPNMRDLRRIKSALRGEISTEERKVLQAYVDAYESE